MELDTTSVVFCKRSKLVIIIFKKEKTEVLRKPDFFIVGAPKCGTTAMTEYLRQHPDIYMPDVKELHYFGSDLVFRKTLNRSPEWFGMTEEKYLSYFSQADSAKRAGEASVLYLYSRNAVREIKKFSPEADIIIMLRNPVDALYSWHGQNLYVCNEDIEDFGEALGAEPDRKEGRRIPDSSFWPEGLLYSEIMRFAEQVERYFSVFGREKVHVMIFDDFKADTAGAYESTLRFLGVSEDFRPDFEVVNPSKRLRFKCLQSFLTNPPQFLRPFADAVSKVSFIRRLISRRLKSFNTAYEKLEPIDPEIRRKLQADFAPEVERISEVLGRDLTHWTRD
jgi:hypothetical protein